MFTADHSLSPVARIRRAAIAGAAVLSLLIWTGGAHGEGAVDGQPAGRPRTNDMLTLLVGQAEVVRYAQEPRTIIIGDPAVATASLATSDILVLTGLEAGETNLIVLDDSGVQIDRMTLRIVERGETVVLRRGIEREVLRCHPLCLPKGASGAASSDAEPSRVIGGTMPETGAAAPAGAGG